MPDTIDSLKTFSRLKASVDAETRLYDRRSTKHVRYTAENGVYLHRGFSGSNAAKRKTKRENAGQWIWTAIVFEHSRETADTVFKKVLGESKPRQAVTLEQLDRIDAELKKLRTGATARMQQPTSLTKSEQVQRLTLQAKTAIRDSDKYLYSVVAKAIRDAPPDVRRVVMSELAVYERAVGLTLGKQVEANLEARDLALASEELSIVRSRTVNLLKMLDPDFEAASLSRHDDDDHDDDTTLGRIRNEFNRQNVHANVDGKTKTQGMTSSTAPQFVATRSGSLAAQSDMVKSLANEKWQPELLVQTFFMPWQDTQGSRVSHSGKAAPIRKQDESLALLDDLCKVAKHRARQGLLPLKVKILIDDPKIAIDSRSPSKQSLKALRQELKRIDPKGAQVEIWGGRASGRGSHHKKMTVALGSQASRDDKFGVLVQTGNLDTTDMLESSVKLTGRDAAHKQRKQFYAETLDSGRLLATNGPSGARKKVEQSSKQAMRQSLKKDPPRNDRNAGNTLMTHQPPNSTLENQFRLSEPYTLIKAGLRSAKNRVRIVMPYFQLVDLNDEIKGALARGVDVDIVLARDVGVQEMLGQSNRESADDLAEFRRELAKFNGEDTVGKLNIGWFKGPPKGLVQHRLPSEFNPGGSDYPHQKFVSIDDEATIMGSFNADYQSMHSAEQMVMVPSDETTNLFLDYMVGNSVPHHRLPRPPNDQSRPLSLPLKLVRSYIGPRSYERLGLNSRASKALPYNRENDDRYQQRFESIDESVSSVHEQQSLNPMGNDDDRR